jgi:hypothetical protein
MALWRLFSSKAEPNEPERMYQDLRLSIFVVLISPRSRGVTRFEPGQPAKFEISGLVSFTP